MRVVLLLTVLFISLSCASAHAEDTIIRISTSYKTLLSTPEQTGMLDQVIKEAFQRIGVKAEIVFTPNERSLVAVNDGIYDAEINRVAGMEKKFPNLVQVPEPNMTMHFVPFASQDIPISGWESLRPLRVGLEKGWKILEQNTEGFPNVTSVMNADQLFQMLHVNRIDVALYSKLGGYELIRTLKCGHIHHLEPPLASKDMFLYLHKDHEEFVEPVAEALREMKRDGTYDRIVQETIGFLQ
ncbi:transporter substrate-binding domain-containing protein [Myxococcota bacterium]|nr:transporter substrate-binding domain-containing protein [Myxococcota bacterium]